MSKKKKIDKIELDEFPTEMLVTLNQLDALRDYSVQEKGVVFEGGIEYRLVVVSGPKLPEETLNEGNED